ncbi:MAG: GNAT family N-acetyltransferase [Candidatus Omnitrophota bacterium]
MLRLMREDDCLDVARLHIEEFSQDDLLPSLGVGALRLIYKGMLREEKSIGYIAEEDKRIIGFITGSEDAGGLLCRCVRKEFIPLSFHVLKALIRKPLLIARIPQAFAYNKKTELDTPAELMSVAVKEGYRGKGFGRKLTEVLIADIRKRGADKVKVAVNKSNAAANIFYKKMGFIYQNTFKFCNKDMNLYVINI